MHLNNKSLSTKHQLIGYFINIFFRYFSLKIYSITTAIIEIFKKNYQEESQFRPAKRMGGYLVPKFTRLINSWYLTKSIPFFFLASLIFFLASCAKNTEAIYHYSDVDKRLHEYFKKFEEEGKKRGLTVDLEKSNISGSIATINVNGIVGLCNYSANKVIIDEDFWTRSSNASKELIVFHELGHCYLHLSHNTIPSNDGVCKSIMRPGDGGCLDFYNATTRVKLIDGLFFN